MNGVIAHKKSPVSACCQAIGLPFRQGLIRERTQLRYQL